LPSGEPFASPGEDLKDIALYSFDDNSEMHLRRNPITAIMKW